MQRSAAQEAEALFIRRWGEMAAGWGISRTMAEIHALLYLTTEPLCMDDMMDRLQISRGNASMNLRQLVNWGLIQRIHHRGDRREYFTAESNVWQMFETIIRERRRREVEPIVETLERCQTMVTAELKGLKGKNREDAEVQLQRFRGILDFFAAMNGLSNAVFKLGPRGLATAAKLLQHA